ncbi:MAG: class I SAM-dependent DNA methyltransferase [Candidatus Thorarchaeota archaeon]
MSPERTPELFDSWASSYDYWIEIGSDSFPFRGYDNVLNRIVRLTECGLGSRILDVGIGTGNLALRFVEFGCEIWGIDYSSRMLEEAKKKVPNAKLFHVNVESEWPPDIEIGFDSIVSAYTLHHLTLERKVRAVKRIANDLLRDGGKLVVGDVSFTTSSNRASARIKLASSWDDDEYYWAADEFIQLMDGFSVSYEQVSDFGGVYLIVPAP